MRHADIVVVGGGVFGLSCAFHLAEVGKVVVLEKHNAVMKEASTLNFGRHHYGYHYVWSPETAKQCIQAVASFELEYGSACIFDFPAYYCVSVDSDVAAIEYLDFCRDMGLWYSEEYPSEEVLDRSKVLLSLRVREGVYDFSALRKLFEKRLEREEVELCLLSEVESYSFGEGRYVVRTARDAYEARVLVFCTYSGMSPLTLEYTLHELCVAQAPIFPVAVTIMDGEFPSVLPWIGEGFVVGHVAESLLGDFLSSGFFCSRWKEIREASAVYFPFLLEADYHRSIFSSKALMRGSLRSGKRLSEVVHHEPGLWSVLGGKIVTCEEVGRQVAGQVRSHLHAGL